MKISERERQWIIDAKLVLLNNIMYDDTDEQTLSIAVINDCETAAEISRVADELGFDIEAWNLIY